MIISPIIKIGQNIARSYKIKHKVKWNKNFEYYTFLPKYTRPGKFISRNYNEICLREGAFRDERGEN